MAKDNVLKFVMFLGSTRDGRMGQRVARFVQRQMEAKTHSITLLDPLELDIPLLKQPLHFYRDPAQAPDILQKCDKTIREADGYVVLSPEYNCGIPPALSNIMNHFSPKSYSFKPSGIVSYSMGIYGGVRAGLVLRPFLAELGCISVHQTLGIPRVHTALDEEGTPLNDRLEPGLNKLIAELEWMAAAMKNHRETVGLPGKQT